MGILIISNFMRGEMGRRDFLKVLGIGAAVSAEACAATNPLLEVVMSELEREKMPRPLPRIESAEATRDYDEFGRPIKYEGKFKSNAGEGEYFVSQVDSPFKEAERKEDDIGARDILYRVGFHVDDSSEQEKNLIFGEFKQKADFLFGVSEEFKQVIYKIVKELLSDKTYFNLVSKHLRRGGKFLFFPDSCGHYDESNIEIGKGPEDSEEKIKSVIIHELLHGVTKRLGLYQHADSGGDDHKIIRPLAERIYFTEVLLSGGNPFGQMDLANYDGWKSSFDNSMAMPTAEFQRCIKANDYDGLIKYIESGGFAENKTRHEIGNIVLEREMHRNIRKRSIKLGNLTLTIEENKFNPVRHEVQKDAGDQYISIVLGDVNSTDQEQLAFIDSCGQELSPEERVIFRDCLEQMKSDPSLGADYITPDNEIRDVAHVVAIKNAVFAESTRLAALVARKKNVNIVDAPADIDFQKVFRNFLKTFSEVMTDTKTPPPFFLARKAMDACLAEA